MNDYPKNMKDKQEKNFLEAGNKAKKEIAFHNIYRKIVGICFVLILIIFIINMLAR